MYVIGFSNSTFSPSTVHSDVWPSNPALNGDAPFVFATWSTTSKPTLCRLLSYFVPGLPRPTTSFIAPLLCPDPSFLGCFLVRFGLAPDQFGFGGASLNFRWLNFA